MTKRQYKKLVDNVTHIEVDNLIYDVAKIIGPGIDKGSPILFAECVEDNTGVFHLEFSKEALMSGEIDKDGEVYIKEMGDSTDCQFRPLTMRNIF